jgi:transposase
MNSVITNTELSSLEGTRCQFMAAKPTSSLGLICIRSFTWWSSRKVGVIPNRRNVSPSQSLCIGAAKLKEKSGGAELYAVYEACGFGFTLQRNPTALGIHCYVVCPQKLDERNRRVKTDGLDAKALCLKLDRFVQGNRDALASVRVPTEQEEQQRAIHRQREQLVKARKRLEGQGRSLMVNHGVEPVQQW